MALNFPNIDPVIMNIWGPLSIRWYSLSYISGILIGWLLLKRINTRFSLGISKDFLENMLIWTVLGIVIGGRLGYITFYDIKYYLQFPMEAIQTWNGGMSFHGGMIGLVIAIYLCSKKYQQNFLKIIDLISCIAPIGLFFGRIANFINGELYGKVTNVPWAVVFPTGGYLPRHPSQLYEAFFEGMVIFIVQYFLLKFIKIRQNHGLLAAFFLMQYGIFRFLIEFFREPDVHIGYIYGLTMGQILCVIMVCLSIIIITFKATTNQMKLKYGS